MALTRDQILSARDVTLGMQSVEVPEWGGSVNIRVMTGTDRGRFEAGFKNLTSTEILTHLLAFTLCDDEGNLLFTANDVEALGTRSSVVIERLTDIATKINLIGPKAVEDAAKNSETARS